LYGEKLNAGRRVRRAKRRANQDYSDRTVKLRMIAIKTKSNGAKRERAAQ
jgi:hypothetical protein